jgi:hypothetical protein
MHCSSRPLIVTKPNLCLPNLIFGREESSCPDEHGIGKEACNAKSGRVGPTFGSYVGGKPALKSAGSKD